MISLEEFLRLHAEVTQADAPPLVDGDARLAPRERANPAYGEQPLDAPGPTCDLCLEPSAFVVRPRKSRTLYNSGQPLYFCGECMAALNAGDAKIPKHKAAGDHNYSSDWIDGRYELSLPRGKRPTLAQYDRQRPRGVVDRYTFGIYRDGDLD